MAFLMFDSSRFTFLSTPSARRATEQFQKDNEHFTISIHALREEGDGAAGIAGWHG